MSKDKNRVYIFDTTMRDGEQSPGASMSLEEKIQIAIQNVEEKISNISNIEIDAHQVGGLVMEE